MKVKQAVKHLTLLSIMAISISACSSSQDTLEQSAQDSVVVEKQPTQTSTTVDGSITSDTNIEGSYSQTSGTSEGSDENVSRTVINNGVINIPVLDDAQVFAELTGSLPAVINYFTNASEAQAIDFYQQAFGKANSQERKRGRLTLKYTEGEEAMRVVISQQNKKRQVDVIIESNK